MDLKATAAPELVAAALEEERSMNAAASAPRRIRGRRGPRPRGSHALEERRDSLNQYPLRFRLIHELPNRRSPVRRWVAPIATRKGRLHLSAGVDGALRPVMVGTRFTDSSSSSSAATASGYLLEFCRAFDREVARPTSAKPPCLLDQNCCFPRLTVAAADACRVEKASTLPAGCRAGSSSAFQRAMSRLNISAPPRSRA
jgi:hypothetical protein